MKLSDSEQKKILDERQIAMKSVKRSGVSAYRICKRRSLRTLNPQSLKLCYLLPNEIAINLYIDWWSKQIWITSSFLTSEHWRLKSSRIKCFQLAFLNVIHEIMYKSHWLILAFSHIVWMLWFNEWNLCFCFITLMNDIRYMTIDVNSETYSKHVLWLENLIYIEALCRFILKSTREEKENKTERRRRPRVSHKLHNHFVYL